MSRMNVSARVASWSLLLALSTLCGAEARAQFPDPLQGTGLEGGGWMRPFQPQDNPINWDVTPPPPFTVPPGQWLVYHYREPNGTPAMFLQVGPAHWINDGNGHRFEFIEVNRDPRQVTLLDRSRGLYYQIRADGHGFFTSGGPWNYNGSGTLQVRR